MKKRKDITENKRFKQYSEYFESIRDDLVKADEIRQSPEYIRAFNYFQVMCTRKRIKAAPTRNTGYKVILNDAAD